MAYNEISLPNWQQLVRRVFGLTGPGGNVPVVSPEITGVAILQGDNAEFHRLRQQLLWACQESQLGAAGNKPAVALVNPAGSGIIATVVRVFGWFRDTGGGGTIFQLKMDTQTNVEASTPTSGQTSPRDSRMITPGAGIAGCQVRFGNAAAALPGFPINGGVIPAANTVEVFRQEDPIILTPGFGLILGTAANTATTTVVGSYQWYERPLEIAEATG